MLVPSKQALGNRDKKHIVMKIYPISDRIYFTDRTSDLYSYILCLIGQALWNRDRIYSTGRKSWIFCFALLLPQILVNFQNQGQI